MVAISTGPTIPATVAPATLAFGTLTSKVPSKTLKTDRNQPVRIFAALEREHQRRECH